MPTILIVNACSALKDDAVARVVPIIEAFDKKHLTPAYGLEPATYIFIPRGAIPTPSTVHWPIYLNLHSTDPGALGWHDDEKGAIFSRVFVGDCIQDHVDWLVDLTHEAWEMRGNPALNMMVDLPDGTKALRELADPVEDDLYAISIGNGLRVSDFVLPSYWRPGSAGPWDFGGHLKGPCPTLTSGGYQSLLEGGQWVQKTARLADGSLSWRSRRPGRCARFAAAG